MPSPLWSEGARKDVRNARRNRRVSFAVAYKQMTTPRAAPKGRRKSLQEQGTNATLRFGRHMPQMLELIERNKASFHREPFHVGLSVSLKNMDDAKVVMLAIGRCLNHLLLL